MDSKKLLFYLTFAFSVLLEFSVRYFDLWNTIPYCDKIMHFFWGFNIFLFLVIFLKWKPLDALIGVFIWQMTWELWEMIDDLIFTQPDYMLDHFYFDGIIDTIVDLIGGLAAWLLLYAAFKVNKKELKPFWNINTLYVFKSCVYVVIIVGAVLSHIGGSSENTFALIGLGISFMVAGIYYFGWEHHRKKN